MEPLICGLGKSKIRNAIVRIGAAFLHFGAMNTFPRDFQWYRVGITPHISGETIAYACKNRIGIVKFFVPSRRLLFSLENGGRKNPLLVLVCH
jgi:hypothetical protein